MIRRINSLTLLSPWVPISVLLAQNPLGRVLDYEITSLWCPAKACSADTQTNLALAHGKKPPHPEGLTNAHVFSFLRQLHRQAGAGEGVGIKQSMWLFFFFYFFGQFLHDDIMICANNEK